MRFFDTNHLHDNEEVDNMDDLKPFNGRHEDQLRKGNIQSEDQFTSESYNKQLIKHNKMYSTVVADFISNSETIVKHLHNLPHHELMSNMTELATRIDSRFGRLAGQFDKYKEDLESYKDYLVKTNAERVDERMNKEAESNEYARQQKDLVGKIKGMSQ